jgi:flavin-dependent dehydrogenase
MKLKVAIMGAGITGAYLYRLLNRGGQKTDIFNKKPGTSCGINPCGWGTSHEFTELVSASGLNSSLYILASSDYVFMHGFKIRANLMTIDKPRLIRDLLQGAEVSYSQPNPGEYDRVIDATGVARVFLPPIENDIVVQCTQFKIKTDAPRSNETSLGRIGYAWCFPLANNTYGHEIWGVGESIGCVPPLVGDGIVSGMKSVQILLDHWNDPSGYARDIIKEFRWMSRERKVVDKLRRNKNLRLRDAWALRKNAGRMGIGVGLKDAAVLLKHLQ